MTVQCSADTFVVNQSLVLRINICGENRHLRQARNRYQQVDSESMNRQHFIFTTLSLVLIYVWTLYSFFDYFNSAQKYSSGSLTLFFNFMGSAIIAAGIGMLLVLTRIILYKSRHRFRVKNNFLYIFAGLSNLNISIIWTISLIMEFLKFELEGLQFMLGNFFVAIFILIDIYAMKPKNKIESVIEK